MLLNSYHSYAPSQSTSLGSWGIATDKTKGVVILGPGTAYVFIEIKTLLLLKG